MTPLARTPLLSPPPLVRDYAAVLLDLDGTLIDSQDSIERAWGRWCRRYGVESAELDGLLHGRTAVDLISLVRPYWSAGQVDEAAGYQLRLQETDPRPGTALAGARALLDALVAGHRWAVVTACTGRLARHRLTHGDLPLPPVLLSCEDVTRGKPDPEPYLAAAARLGLAPADCLVVEDAPAGVRSGVAAGCTVVAVTSTHRGEELGEAHAVVSDLSELVLGAPVPAGQ